MTTAAIVPSSFEAKFCFACWAGPLAIADQASPDLFANLDQLFVQTFVTFALLVAPSCPLVASTTEDAIDEGRVWHHLGGCLVRLVHFLKRAFDVRFAAVLGPKGGLGIDGVNCEIS